MRNMVAVLINGPGFRERGREGDVDLYFAFG